MYLGVKLNWLIENNVPFERQFMKVLLVNTETKTVCLQNGNAPIMLEVPFEAIHNLKGLDQCTC